LICSSSSSSELIQVWEPKTLAPYEPLSSSKFIPGANTLQASSHNFIWASHAQKNFMTVWRWDKKEALLRFPLKEPLSVFKISRSQNEAGTSQICVGATQKGTFTVWQGSTG